MINTITVTEGKPIFRKDDVSSWPQLLAEGPNGPVKVVITYFRVAGADPDGVLSEFKRVSRNKEAMFFRFSAEDKMVSMPILAMRKATDSKNHLIFWLREVHIPDSSLGV